MSETKKEREKPPKQQQAHKDHQDEHNVEPPLSQPPPPPPLFLPTTSSYSPFDFEPMSCVGSSNIVKRPRYTTSAPPPITHQWKQQSPMGQQNPELSPTHSNPQAQLITSPDTSSSPSLSPMPSSSSALETTKLDHHQQQQQFRKGKYVSPVWKPHEMLWLAKAWRVQYQGDGSGSGPGLEPGTDPGGRGKTRAEKDKEVAEFLNRHGVSRDAKTAGTKWDNMLGEFRKVYEWERGGERESVGKSYFRLSPYERKIHRLPASFDEQVFEELSQFMGPKLRSSNVVVSNTSPTSFVVHHGNQLQSTRLLSSSSSGDLSLKVLPHQIGNPFREDDHYPISSMVSARTRQMEQYMMRNPRSVLLGYEPPNHPMLEYGMSPTMFSTMPGSRAELRRVGRMRLTWDESVNLWAEEGEYHRGRVKLHGSGLLNADELMYFDDSMVASSLEAFEDGPLKGFSIDKFVPGQQLKVFGRSKSSSSSNSGGINERFAIPIAEPCTGWEFQDPTDYHLGCLRVPPGPLPNLVELSWYIQEPPPEEFRLPLHKDIYRDLPQGRELFFTTSNEPLYCKSFTIDILSSLIRSTPSISASTSSSRDSYIGLWDDCINRVVSKFCPIEMAFTRKQPVASSSSETLQDHWPNMSGMVKNLCLWRGEEIDQVRGSQSLDPSSTITSKIAWTYHDLPYVLGYYAIGHNVTFCALCPSSTSSSSSSSSSSSQITRTDLYSIDLANPSERIKSLVPCWRIGMLLASLAERCSKNYCHSDFERQDLGDGNIIEKTPNSVTIFYANKRRWLKVKEIYDMLDQRVPHAEQLSSYNEIDLLLVFKPRGFNTRPKNCEQLILALKQVTKSLVALHDLSFMHRDLSWEKVMLRTSSTTTTNHIKQEEEDEGKWFVGGFDEAVGAPQINPVVAVEGSGRHAPEMARGVHGVKVDVWGIGYLVKTSGVKVTKSEEMLIGKKLKELEERCMEQNPEQRPTAADCYHHLLQIQTSLSSATAARR